MIEEFEVLDKIRYRSAGTVYKYKFKLNGTIYHSQYNVADDSQIYVFQNYSEDIDFQTESIAFSKESREEIKLFILKQKKVRLRHLMNPYTFV